MDTRRNETLYGHPDAHSNAPAGGGGPGVSKSPRSTGTGGETAGISSGFPGIAQRMLRDLTLASAPDAGQQPGGLLVYQVAQGGLAETNLCSEPKTGLWRKTVRVKSLSEVVQAAKGETAQSGLSRLGILAHGDVGGLLTVGDDVLHPASFDDFKPQFEALRPCLAGNAEFYILGCVTGAGPDGSALLKGISEILRGVRVIAFNVINAVNPKNPRREGGIFSKACYDPEVWATGSKSALDAALALRDGKLWQNLADEKAPQAKIAKDGKIVKWPSDEDPKKNDGTIKGSLRNWKKGGK